MMLETYMNYNIPGSASKLECDTIEKSLIDRVGISNFNNKVIARYPCMKDKEHKRE